MIQISWQHSGKCSQITAENFRLILTIAMYLRVKRSCYDLGDIGLKANIAVGVLMLGLDHNRWFVERKFLQMASPTVADPVIQRMIVEMSVLGIDFNHQFWRMINSIQVIKTVLHPSLQVLVLDAN